MIELKPEKNINEKDLKVKLFNAVNDKLYELQSYRRSLNEESRDIAMKIEALNFSIDKIELLKDGVESILNKIP